MHAGKVMGLPPYGNLAAIQGVCKYDGIEVDTSWVLSAPVVDSKVTG
jgi:hypothetical protein